MGVVSPAQPARSESLTPHVAFAFSFGIPNSSATARTCFPVLQPRAQLHRFEAPSTNKSHRLFWLSPASTAWAATGILTRRQRSGFRHAFTLLPRSARLCDLPAVHRGLKATCCLSASATECPPSTPAHRPNSRELVANHLSLNDDIPFGLPPTELSQARGHLACLTASTPTGCDRSPQWIYPDPTGSGTPCRETVPS